MRLAAMMIALPLASGAASAMDGETLNFACSAPETSALHGFCSGYIAGAIDGIRHGEMLMKIRYATRLPEEVLRAMDAAEIGPALCAPADITPKAARLLVSDFLSKQSEKWRRDTTAELAVWAALTDIYPCP
ncbi:Rap1a/Tai family immunity protein [Paracoccus versutus]|uniref:Rap1a/Tai family immunity protein n=1 Tax=Paracoccus versutus TaxID=34007 RepID=UPI0011C03464|nr:Rap1a/Tai family immunity protein [Paracoccus versutus]